MSEWASVHADRFSSAEDDDDAMECGRCGKVVEGDDLYEVKSDLAANKGADILVCHACWKSIQSEPAAVTCHTCGAVVDGNALAVQMAADGSPRLDRWYCATHLIAGLERLQAALRAQREGDA